jgi:hypothetical protein
MGATYVGRVNGTEKSAKVEIFSHCQDFKLDKSEKKVWGITPANDGSLEVLHSEEQISSFPAEINLKNGTHCYRVTEKNQKPLGVY